MSLKWIMCAKHHSISVYIAEFITPTPAVRGVQAPP